MRISIIIATINRSKQLEKYTIPSLERQTVNNFDTIVWDASENELTQMVCSKSKIGIMYFKAPRVGLAKQRNDAVQKAFELYPNNEIILFIDDDVVLSDDALEGVINTYAFDQTISGVGIPLSGTGKKTFFLKKIIKGLFLNFEFKKRHITNYAYSYFPINEKNSECVNWLSGCSMSYKKECFDSNHFDERLCTFGGYSLAEDALFSSSLFHSGHKLKLSDKGRLQHIRDTNARLDYRKWVASISYNHYLLFLAINKNQSLFKRIVHRLAYNWNQFYNLSLLFFSFVRKSHGKDFFDGLRDASREKRKIKK